MTDKKQPEALRLAEYFEIFTKSSHRCPDGRPIHIAAAAEFRRLHAENSNLHAQLDAVGAGGVGAMLPRHAQPAPAMPVPWVPGPNEFKDWCSRWFGPDADDSYLAKAAFDLPPTAQQFERPAAPQPQQIAEPESRAAPSVKGIYAWVPENGPPALLHVNKRPSSHSSGGILNAHVLQSPSFYDGCAVSQWGPGCWILLRSLEIKKEQS